MNGYWRREIAGFAADILFLMLMTSPLPHPLPTGPVATLPIFTVGGGQWRARLLSHIGEGVRRKDRLGERVW